MLVKFLTKYLLYGFLLTYGGEVYLGKETSYDLLLRYGGKVFLEKRIIFSVVNISLQ